MASATRKNIALYVPLDVRGRLLSVRWLHISDVHECSREGFHRVGMYEAIVRNVKQQPAKPDIVFFTGDLAFSGTNPEYGLLRERFLDPLRAALPKDCPIFTVPGNHDVDRKRAGNPRSWMTDVEQQRMFQQVDEDGRQKRVDMILPRFEAYRTLEHALGAWGEDWLASEMGAACATREINGKRVAVVGINTAWLCHDDEDWGRLTAGRTMVDAALKRASDTAPSLIIVIGHHPLAAMTGEKDWSDGERIRSRLEQANAIYLHGHLHRSGAQKSGDAMQSALAIQAPSGFQAGDSPIWRNGVMWGEANLATGRLVIEPLRWNDDHREYVFDTDAAPSRLRIAKRDAYAYPLPGPKPENPPAASLFSEQPIVPAPEGWRIIDAAELARLTAERLTTEEMADWFNGSFPRWEAATAAGVRPRQIVDGLVRTFEAAHHAAPRPVARLLTGAGGEGKSAALLQTAAGLLRGVRPWTCLWRQSSTAGLPGNWLELMPPKPDHAWIVTIDDAENVAAGLPSALHSFNVRTDVHFVLAAREADWVLRGLNDQMWQRVADFRRVRLVGLDEEDARRIADGWAAWGGGAMGRLQNHTSEGAAKILLDNARELAGKHEEGSLLGALLMTREGEELRQRVSRLMAPWVSAPGVGDKTLLDIYAMIAAMHAENQLYLSRTVLAFALRCDELRIDCGPLRVLRSEAMVDGGTTYVLTRHRRIAEAARDWLVESGYKVDRWYPFLARSALSEFLKNRGRNQDINSWHRDLARHFLNAGPVRWSIARAISKALFEVDRDDPLRLTDYSHILRATEQPGEALALMREHAPRFPGRRDVLYEWGVSAGAAGDLGLDVWLVARSLADDRRAPFLPNNVRLALAGLGSAFRELAATTCRSEFAAAQAACGRLGLRIPELDPTGRKYFEAYAAAAPSPSRVALSVESDITMFSKAAAEASYEAELENVHGLDALIGEPDGYSYKMLAAAVSGENGDRRNNSGNRS